MSELRAAAEPQEFRKKPVVIEAMLNDGTHDGVSSVIAWINANTPRYDPQDETTWQVTGYYGEIRINTLEGEMIARKGDWVIRGVKGEFYPCKPDIFAQTYEPAALSAQAEPGQQLFDGFVYDYRGNHGEYVDGYRQGVADMAKHRGALASPEPPLRDEREAHRCPTCYGCTATPICGGGICTTPCTCGAGKEG